MDDILQKEIKRLKNLRNYKGLSDDELQPIAELNLKLKEFRKNCDFTDPAEKEKAEERFKNYISQNHIESQSDLDTLNSLIYNEVLEFRIQKELNRLAGDNKFPPQNLTKTLTEVQNQKLSLKLKLGIDKDGDKESDLTTLQKIEKRFQKHIEENRHEFTMTCGSCGDLLLVRRRVADFDNLKHPWFAGRWFFNYPLLKLVKDKTITKEQAWQVMCDASKGGDTKPAFSKKYCVDYITYCLDKWNEITNSLENN